MEVKLPDKLTFKRREVVQLTKLDGRVLDYWESEFGGFIPVMNESGDKFYSRRDVEHILKIKRLLLEEKVEKSRLRELLQVDTPSNISRPETVGNGKPWPEKREIIKRHLQEILTLLNKRGKK